jgi:lipooligosaccharide transport system permease protein
MVDVQTGPREAVRAGLLLRVLPPGLYAGMPGRVMARSALVTWRKWPIFVSGFAEPLLYLFAFQIGFSALVSDVTGPGGQAMSYEAFVAPALLAAAAMNGAIFETTFPVYFKMRHSRLYDAMLATPIGPYDVALGEIGWAVLRGGLYSTAFVAIMAAMGLVTSPWALLMVPVAVLIAFAFAAVGMALATFLRSPTQFDFILLIMMPIFLFSTTFFPLTVYPESVQWLVRISPLYHGVELTRGLSVGVLDAGMVGHVAYLLALAAVGVWAASRRITTLLR